MAIVVDQDIPDELLDLYLANLRPADENGRVGIKQLDPPKAYPSLAQLAWRFFFKRGTVCFGTQNWAARQVWFLHAEEYYWWLFYYNVFMKCWLLGPYNFGLGSCPPTYCIPFHLGAIIYEVMNLWGSFIQNPRVELWTDRGADWKKEDYADSKGFTAHFYPNPSAEESTLSFQFRAVDGIPTDPDYAFQSICARSPDGGTIIDAETIQFLDKPLDEYADNIFYVFRGYLWSDIAFSHTCIVQDTNGVPIEDAMIMLWQKRRIGWTDEWEWLEAIGAPVPTNSHGCAGADHDSVNRPSDPPVHNELISDFRWVLDSVPEGYAPSSAYSLCGSIIIDDETIELQLTEGGMYGTNFFVLEEIP